MYVLKPRREYKRGVYSSSLGLIPWSLATEDGAFRDTSKSVLGKKLQNQCASAETDPDPSACVTDGMAMVNRFQGDKQVFREIADALLSLAGVEGQEN